MAKEPLIIARDEIYAKFTKLNILREDVDLAVDALDKRRYAEKKNKKYLSKAELNTLIVAEADKLINTAYKNETKENKKSILSEANKYKGAKENINDKDFKIRAKSVLEDIRVKRENRTMDSMKEEPSLYKEVTWKNKKVYISKEPNDAILGMQQDFDAYTVEFNDNTDESRDTFTKCLEDFSQRDQRHSKGYTIPKTDRSNMNIPKFHVELKPEKDIDEFTMAKVEIDPTLIVPGEVPEAEQPLIVGPANDPTVFIDQAFEAVKEESFRFRTGSPEYKAIYDGLKALTSKHNPPTIGDEAVHGTLPKYLKILAVMDRYLNRKDDEKDAATAKHKSENSNSKKRREAVRRARFRLTGAIEDIKRRNNIKDDLSMEMLSCQLEYEAEYNKIHDNSVTQIIEALRSAERKEAQKAVEEYLVNNVDRYKHEEGYSFKKDVDGIEQKIRIPKENKEDNNNERIYAIMLRGYEEIARSNRKYYTDNLRAELPDFTSGLQHFATAEKNGVLLDINVNEKLGTNIDTNGVDIDFTLTKAKSIKEYADQFEDYYKYCVSKVKNDVYSEAVDPDYQDEYRLDYINTPFDPYSMRKLTGAAFSNLYLKALEESKPEEFNFEEVDQNRRKILTLINNTPIRNKIEECMKKHFRLKKFEKDIEKFSVSAESREEMRDYLSEKENMISTPSKFNMHIVGEAVEMTVKEYLTNINRLMNDARNNKEQIKTEFESFSKVVMVAKGIGLSYILDSCNTEIKENYKGNTFEETMKNLQALAKTKLVQKQVDPAKKVEPHI